MSLFLRRTTLLTTSRFSSTNTALRTTSLFNNNNNNHFSRPFSHTTAAMGVHNIQNKADYEALLKEEQLAVIDCFATWCGPCKVIAPQVVKFSDAYPNAKFYKLDVDEVPDVAQELSVRAMPTFFLFKGGEKVGEVVGANPVALEAAIKKAL